MERKRVNMFVIENKYKDIIEAIEQGYVFAGRGSEGACIFINNKGKGNKLKCIMSNTISCTFTRFELDKNMFKKIYNDYLSKLFNAQYKIEDNKDDMIEQFYNLGNAIHAMETGSYKNYKARKLS